MEKLSGGSAQHVDYEPLTSPDDAFANSTHVLAGKVVSFSPGVSFVSDPNFPAETTVEYASMQLKVTQDIKDIGYDVAPNDICHVQVLLPPGVDATELPLPAGEVVVFATAETMEESAEGFKPSAELANSDTVIYAFYDGLWANDENGEAVNISAGEHGTSSNEGEAVWPEVSNVESIVGTVTD